MRVFLLLAVLFLSVLHVNALPRDISPRLGFNAQSQPRLTPAVSRDFIENQGQWDPAVRYMARTIDGTVWVTDTAIVFDYVLPRQAGEQNQDLRQGHVVSMNFSRSNLRKSIVAKDLSGVRYSYFLGNDPRRHARNSIGATTLIVKEISRNTDLILRIEDGRLRYDVHLGPVATNFAEFSFAGLESDVWLGHNGAHLWYRIAGDTVRHKELKAFLGGEGSAATPAYFEKVSRNKVRLVAPAKSNGQICLIDPVVYSTFLGGGNEYDCAFRVRFDQSDQPVVAGSTNSTNFPTTVGAYRTASAGNVDGFVSKINAAGNGLVFSTYFGGSELDEVQGMTIAPNGDIVCAGWTQSGNLPQTAGAYDPTYGGNNSPDGFLFVLSGDGSTLRNTTYFGDNSEDRFYSVDCDAANNIYATGWTSGIIPTTAGVLQPASGGLTDGFVTKFNPTLGTLLYSTYLGGAGMDRLVGIDVDQNNQVCVVGGSASGNYPLAQALQTNNAGSIDLVVTKLNATATALVFSTYLGSPAEDQGFDIARARNGDYCIVGSSEGAFPSTAASFDPSANGQADGVVFRLAASGNSIVWSGFLGGGNTEFKLPAFFPPVVTASLEYRLGGIALDAQENVYVTSFTGSGNYPTQCPDQATLQGPADAVLSVIASNGSRLMFSTYKGSNFSFFPISSGLDCGLGVGVSASGRLFMSGFCAPGFPTTSGALQTTARGLQDAFVWAFDLPRITANAGPDRVLTCAQPSATIGQPATGGFTSLTYSWSPTTGLSNAGIAQPTVTTTEPVTTYVMTVSDGCLTSTDTVVVRYNEIFRIGDIPAQGICRGDSTAVTITSQPAGVIRNVSWSPVTGVSNPTATNVRLKPSVSTRYIARVESNDGCVLFDTVDVAVLDQGFAVQIEDDRSICQGDTFQLGVLVQPAGAIRSIAWSPREGLSDSSIQSPMVFASRNTRYTVTVIDTNGCVRRDTFNLTVFSARLSLIADTVRTMCPRDTIEVTMGFTQNQIRQVVWQPAGILSAPGVRQRLSPTSTTRYTVLVEDLNGCFHRDTLEVVVNPKPSFTLPDTLVRGTDGAIHAAPLPSGTGPFRYSWTPATLVSSPTDWRPFLRPLGSSMFYVQVTDANGCTSRDSIFVVVRDQLLLRAPDTMYLLCGRRPVDTVVITNAGGTSRDVLGAQVVGTEFGFTLPALPTTISAGGELRIPVVYNPTSIALHQSALLIRTNATDADSLLTVRLFGRRDSIRWTTTPRLNVSGLCAIADLDTFVVVQNQSDVPAIFLIASDSFAVDRQSIVVAPGGIDTVRVTSMPGPDVLSRSGVIEVRDTVCGSLGLIPVSVIVQPTSLEISPVVMVGIPGGPKRTAVVRFTNTGTQRIRVFEFSPLPEVTVTRNPLPVDLEPGEFVTMDIEYQFQDTIQRTTEYEVRYEPCSGLDTGVIVTRGTQTAFPEIDIRDRLTFTTRCDVPVVDSFTISNIGLDTLRVASLELVGAGASRFQVISPRLPRTIPPGDSNAVVVRYLPLGRTRDTVQVRVISNSATNDTVLVPVLAQNTVPSISYTKQQSGGVLCYPQALDYPIIFTNSGPDPAQYSYFDFFGEQVRNVPPGGADTIRIQVRGPAARLRIREPICNTLDTITITTVFDSVVVEATGTVIEGVVGGPPVRGVIRLENRGNRPATIAQAPDVRPATLISPQFPLTLPLGGTDSIVVEFTPVRPDSQLINARLDYQPCTRFVIPQIVLRGINTAYGISVGDATGSPGDAITIPVTFSTSNPPSVPLQVTLWLSANSSMLEVPGSQSPATIVNGRRTIQTVLTLDAQQSSVTRDVSYRVLLGNDTTTSVTVDSFLVLPSGAQTQILRQGRFSLTGFCTVGGPRLFSGNGTFSMSLLFPNPVDSRSRLTVSALAQGRATIELFDLLGTRVATLFDNTIPAGASDLALDFSAVANGAYTLVYRANGLEARLRVVVFR